MSYSWNRISHGPRMLTSGRASVTVFGDAPGSSLTMKFLISGEDISAMSFSAIDAIERQAHRAERPAILVKADRAEHEPQPVSRRLSRSFG